MKIQFIRNQLGNLLFDVDGTRLNFWNVFTNENSIVSLEDYSNRYCFNRYAFHSTEEDITKFIESNQDLIRSYIQNATELKKIQDDFYHNAPAYKLVKENDGNVVVCSIEFNKMYVSVTAIEIRPETEDWLIESSKEMWIETFMELDGVSEKQAEDKFDELVRYDGVCGVADISLFSDDFTYRNKTYCFDSVGCGCMHETILKLWPELTDVIDLHLKDEVMKGIRICNDLGLKQNVTWKDEVIALGKKIVSRSYKQIK